MFAAGAGTACNTVAAKEAKSLDAGAAEAICSLPFSWRSSRVIGSFDLKPATRGLSITPLPVPVTRTLPSASVTSMFFASPVNSPSIWWRNTPWLWC